MSDEIVRINALTKEDGPLRPYSAWFSTYYCGCSVIARWKEAIPTVCPRHGSDSFITVPRQLNHDGVSGYGWGDCNNDVYDPYAKDGIGPDPRDLSNWGEIEGSIGADGRSTVKNN